MKATQTVLKIVLSLIGGGAILGLAACGGGTASAAPIKATWVTPQINGDAVTILSSDVTNDKIVHFKVPVATGTQMAFMAYEVGGKEYVRADACVPCRTLSFSLVGDTLVCDSCRTVFSATTGAGITGVTACKGYPKASVPFTTSGGQIVMTAGDLQKAWDDTLQPGLP